MSLILDALKRAERERQVDPTPALGDVAAPRPPQPARRRWRILGVLALALIAGAFAWSFKGRKPATTAAAKPGPVASAPAAPAPAPQSAPAPAPATPPPAYVPPILASPPPQAAAAPPPLVIPGTESVASLDDVAPEESVAEELIPATEPEPQAPPPAEASKPAVPEPAPEQAPAPAPRAAPSPPPPAAERPLPRALTQPAPYRKLREMPPDYRADFPALSLEVHVFEPTQRFVMINGRRYKEGERLQEGPQLLEIVRDGVVLEFRGEKVLYPLNR